ncbi:MAG: hypothetical protein KIH69_015895 [Anaerolineae bacterium]|nr:hypothetical protein [Anaerolineae bacterium]
MLQMQVAIVNGTALQGENLEIFAMKSNGQRALVCYYGFTYRFRGQAVTDLMINANHPNVVKEMKIKPNETTNLTLRIFIENNEAISYLYARSSNIGQTNTSSVNISPPATNNQATAVPAASGSMQIMLQKQGYEQWGRPIGMATGSGGCSKFNDGAPVRKFNISMRITNNTNQVLLPYALLPKATKGDGSPAFSCFYGHIGVVTDLAPGQSVDVTYAVFIEQSEFVKSIYLETTHGIRSNTLTF